MYNGYSWDGKNFLYNPASIINFFLEKNDNYWFETGTPTFLINLIIDKSNIENFELDNLKLETLIFQSGYLTIKNIIYKLFSSIPYTNFMKNEIAEYEGFYASVLYSYLQSVGVELIAEDITNKGRIDLTLKFDERVYIFEFKVKQRLKKDETPLEQIKKMRYYDKYVDKNNKDKEVYIIGIVFDSDERNVVEYVWEKIV